MYDLLLYILMYYSKFYLAVDLFLVLTQTTSHRWEIELLTSDSFVNIQDIDASALKVRRCIIRLGNKDLTVGSVVNRLKQVAYRDELLLDRTQQVKTCLQLGVWVCGFNGCAYDRQVPAVGGDLVSIGHAAYIDI